MKNGVYESLAEIELAPLLDCKSNDLTLAKSWRSLEIKDRRKVAKEMYDSINSSLRKIPSLSLFSCYVRKIKRSTEDAYARCTEDDCSFFNTLSSNQMKAFTLMRLAAKESYFERNPEYREQELATG